MMPDPIRIYAAGPMPEYPATAVGRHWRDLLEERFARIATSEPFMPEVRFSRPDAAGCDHGGFDAEQVVLADFALIDGVDGVLVYLPRRDLYGSHVEIGYAVAQSIPVLVYDAAGSVDWEARGTGHQCTCMSDFSPYWFAGTAAHRHSRGGSWHQASPRKSVEQHVAEMAEIVAQWVATPARRRA
ncbi:MAG: hypothetical protein ACRELB_16855 [Polyangiaceae bacterium]